MNAQGSSVIDADYFDRVAKRIRQVTSCSDLQQVVQKEMTAIQAQVSAIKAQLEALGPIAALLEGPSADLTKIVSWIENLIAGLIKPLYQPYLTGTSQLAQIAEGVAKVAAAAEEAAANITSCAISIPAVAISSVTSPSTSS
ncbi:hypothetical protein AA13595_1311 [Gluconacetobacter johannae DSM 13595]|uniref:Uncharacterized protein n=1 Tax=Gluconacetobacter johannae TaxID=112140 RepID=A0A7W4J8R7_9PROT|nr:hypothetical protein [Gluconacetobacter johannae]MBB2176782.1 hypothetical protein [Gluconacetobacter johannae]GBQ84054.1 hypothetical protein AA13595_1311 [Gluconacetobacter johannae DSM 13595]